MCYILSGTLCVAEFKDNKSENNNVSLSLADGEVQSSCNNKSTMTRESLTSYKKLLTIIIIIIVLN